MPQLYLVNRLQIANARKRESIRYGKMKKSKKKTASKAPLCEKCRRPDLHRDYYENEFGQMLCTACYDAGQAPKQPRRRITVKKEYPVVSTRFLLPTIAIKGFRKQYRQVILAFWWWKVVIHFYGEI